jgi:alkylation response protein AidB-like acyl-CoA dehydrogenase
MSGEERVGAEVRSWLHENWDGSCDEPTPFESASPAYLDWMRKVVDARWAVVRWPVKWYGRGLPDNEAEVVEAEFARVRAPGCGQDLTHLEANTVLAFGRDELKELLLRGLLCRQIPTCLLYSEPAAGSDLAGVRTRAELRGDRWIVNGQKVWTSGAAEAEYGLLLARTDWDVPKHAGLSFFICPMKQAGVEVRPIRQITGESHFNEVFLDDVEIPHTHILGEPGTGWSVLMTALAYERAVMGAGAGELPASDQGAAADLVAFARRHGALEDPHLRQQIARVLADRRLNELLLERILADQTTSESSPYMSVVKLLMSRIRHGDAAVRTSILGSASVLEGVDFPDANDVNFRAFTAYVTSIGGGTDQIQRNIVSERILGLPREIAVDSGVPFRNVKSGPA